MATPKAKAAALDAAKAAVLAAVKAGAARWIPFVVRPPRRHSGIAARRKLKRSRA